MKTTDYVYKFIILKIIFKVMSKNVLSQSLNQKLEFLNKYVKLKGILQQQSETTFDVISQSDSYQFV